MTDRYAPCELCGKWHDNRDHVNPPPTEPRPTPGDTYRCTKCGGKHWTRDHTEPSAEASRYVLVRDSDGIRRPYLGCTCHPGPHQPECEPSAEADAALPSFLMKVCTDRSCPQLHYHVVTAGATR